MKTKVFGIGIVFLLAAMVCTTCTKDEVLLPPDGESSALKNTLVLPPEVETAIVSGINWLLTTQNPDGNFGGYSDGVARTALAVTKLCDRSVELGHMPLVGPYATEIQDGLNYIFRYATANPDGGIWLGNYCTDSGYRTGIAMMAVAEARCPDCVVAVPGSLVDGMSYQEVLQETVNFFVTAQNADGAWRYYDHSQPSDNSNTGFAVLGLMAAEGSGIEIPQALKDNLSIFIDFIQNDATGGSGYTHPNDWVNIMKTGNLLFEMAFVGDAPDAPRVLAALEYIGAHWNDAGGPSYYATGWLDNYLAMYCLMKGFVAMDVDIIDVGGSDVDWYEDFVEEILGASPWPLPYSPWLDPYLSSMFGLLTLEKITPVPYLLVDFDVKPESCPNPLNRNTTGVIPMAILGTEQFDVTTIDPTSLNIEGVSPRSWALEDVATPYIGGLGNPPTEMDCTTEGPDGYMDLVMHFYTADIAGLFETNVKGDLIIIHIDGQLVDDGLDIKGEDIMIIKK